MKQTVNTMILFCLLALAVLAQKPSARAVSAADELSQRIDNSHGAGSEENSGLEEMKTELNDQELPRLRAMRSAIDQRVSELTDALRREEIRQRDLQQQANRLKSEQ